jgi:hypothetical protein
MQGMPLQLLLNKRMLNLNYIHLLLIFIKILIPIRVENPFILFYNNLTKNKFNNDFKTKNSLLIIKNVKYNILKIIFFQYYFNITQNIVIIK